jgi:hypothetical protein
MSSCRRQARECKRDPVFDLHEALHDAVPSDDAPLPPATAMARRSPVAPAWFRLASTSKPSHRALARSGRGLGRAARTAYCRRIDGHIRWMRSDGVPVRAVAPIVVDEFTAWCEARGAGARGRTSRLLYAAGRFAAGSRFRGHLAAARRVAARSASIEVLRGGGRTAAARHWRVGPRRMRNENDPVCFTGNSARRPAFAAGPDLA